MMPKNFRFLLFFFLFIYNKPICAQQVSDSTVIFPAKNHFNLCNEEDVIIHHSFFSLVYNDSAEQAEWVAYRLIRDDFNSDISRTNDFREDTTIVKGSASLEDYAGSGYDRGHIAPAAIMKRSRSIMSESFLLSNISPQLPSFNRGIWKRMEEKIRFWAERCDSLFVISGPILDQPIDVIGPNKVAVPSAFFKTVIAFKGDQVTGIAFLMPHIASSESLYSFATSIDKIEEIKGLDFYCNLKIEGVEEIEKNENMKTFIYGKY